MTHHDPRLADAATIPAADPQGCFDLLAIIAASGGAPVAAELLDSVLLDPAGAALSAEDRRYLAGPVIVGRAGTWEETLPVWLPQQVRAERLDLVLGRLPGHRVAPAEIVCALYANTMVAPMRHEIADLYLWAALHANARQGGFTFAEFRKRMFGDDQVPEDADVLAPDGRLFHRYHEFARDLRRRVEAQAPKATGRRRKAA